MVSTLSRQGRGKRILVLLATVIVPLVLAITASAVYFYILAYPWVVIRGVVEAYISPLSTRITYMGIPVRDPGVESSMALTLILGLLVIAVNMLVGISHLPFMSYRVRGSLAYTAIVVSFIYSFVIVPQMFNRIEGFIDDLGISTSGEIRTEAGSGIIVYGRIDVTVMNPVFLGYAAFLFTLVSVVYVFYELYTRL